MTEQELAQTLEELLLGGLVAMDANEDTTRIELTDAGRAAAATEDETEIVGG